MNKKFLIFMAGLLCLLTTTMVIAREKAPAKKQTVSFNKSSAQQGAARTRLNLMNWSYWMYNDGQSGVNPDGDAGGFYPRGTTHVIFQDGFVFGGIVHNNRDPLPNQTMRVGGQTYFIGTSPGHIITPGTPSSPPVSSDANVARIYRIRPDFTALEIGQATVINDAAELAQISASDVTEAQQQAVISGYLDDWNDWPADLGAPFYDVNGNGQYDPGVEEDLNGDGQITIGEREEPGLAGADQVIWFVCNDLDPGATEAMYGSRPIGVELQVTAWCYNQSSATLGQLFFKRYSLINKSGFAIDSMFVSQWCDPDVGAYADDLVGTDIERSLGFAYSGNLTDDEYDKFNLPPASGGYDFFQGPLLEGKAGEDRNNNGVDDAEDFGIFNLQRVGPGYINLPQTSFGYFAAGSDIDDPDDGDYIGTLQWYNLLNGFIPTQDTLNPSPFLAGFGPNRGQPTMFPVSGDPVNQVGDIDAFGDNLPPGDRRMSLASGPFRMPVWEDLNGNNLPDFGEPGVQEVTVAVVGGIVAQTGGNNRNAVAQLKLNDDFAQFIFDNLFEGIPAPPALPIVTVTPLEDKIVLEWGTNKEAYTKTEARDPQLGFHFEGYNVYQLPTRTATKEQATRVATFDLDNTITQINANRFVPEFGDIINVPIQKGTNTGVQRFITIDRDVINGRPIFAGNEFYFAVTAYNAKDADDDGIVDTDVPEPSLESALEVIVVVPQTTRPGTRYPNAPQDALEVNKFGPSTGETVVSVVDPGKITGDNYRIEFNTEEQINRVPVLDSLGNLVDYDTVGIWHTWNLVDESTGQTLLSDQDNLSGDNAYQIVDGLLVQVIGSKAFGLAGWDFEGDRWITGFDASLQEFFGGLDIGANFFGSSLGPPDAVPVLLEFQDQASVDANGYVSQAYTYRRDMGYAFAGIGEAPWAAFDVTDPANPRRLNICYVEDDNVSQENGVNANLIWDMAWNPDSAHYAGAGGREYMFILQSDYNPDPSHPFYTTNSILDDADDFDVLYAIWPDQRGDREYLLAEFTMDIIANVINKPVDEYTFSTQAVVRNNQSLARQDVERVNVYPNPYYAFNPEETSRFERFVTFSHLPEKVTIRIFSLSGVQVRKLTEADKPDPTSQFLKWNLRNEADLPVASGVYVAHIDMQDLGQKTLKLFIVQGAEILEFF